MEAFKARPVILVIMDGIGFGCGNKGDAVCQANTPNLDRLLRERPNVRLKAHGRAVGLPDDSDMGNSEVGHNALGSGQVYSQGAKLVDESIKSGDIFKSEVWLKLSRSCLEKGSTLHLLGLLSDGKVHSNIEHLFALLRQAKAEGLRRVRVHILLDGRDVPSTSALDYVARLETVLDELGDGGFDCAIASGGGRMQITMDRYQADWDMVRRGWDTHVLGIGRGFSSAAEAIETYRRELSVIDQDLPAFVIEKQGAAIGRVLPGDSLILFNFRGDRAIEISQAFDEPDFDRFPRPGYRDVLFAGMLQYDDDMKLPKLFLVEPPNIKNTLTELLVAHGIASFAVSETQKYGHVTYFWNGNKSGKFSEELEDYVEIASNEPPFDEKPEMKSAEITTELIRALQSGKYGFLRCNFPNGDMVGHTGKLEATIKSVEAVDLALGRILKAADERDAVCIITADHGNADDMLEVCKLGRESVRTAHSLNPVPFIIYDKNADYELAAQDTEPGLANVAATVAGLLGLEPHPSWEKGLIVKSRQK